MHRIPVRAIAAFCFLVVLGLACGETAPETVVQPAGTAASGTARPISPVAAADTASAAMRTASAAGEAVAPTARATSTAAAAPTETSDPCLSWEDVTADMDGELICVRGLITKFTQSRQVGTRYSFSDKPNTFFMFSNLWEITNSSTGKTVGVGSCVEVTGVIELQGDVPFIHIDDLITGVGDAIGGFLIYDDPSACG